jgi:ankyrin repeat protein
MLNYAVELGQYDIVLALNTFPQIMKYLEMRDTKGKTPIEWAIYNKDSDMILFLISKGANVEFSDLQTILWNALI